MGIVNYIPQGVDKVVTIILKFPTLAGEPDICRLNRNVMLTQNFKKWLSEQISVPVSYQTGDVNSVEFLWSSKLDAIKINRALNVAHFYPEVAEATILFQDRSAITI